MFKKFIFKYNVYIKLIIINSKIIKFIIILLKLKINRLHDSKSIKNIHNISIFKIC